MPSRRKYSKSLGAGLIILSSLFYASYGIWTKLMGDFFGGFTASADRSVIVLIFMLPVAVLMHRIGPWHFRRNWKYLTGMILASTMIWGTLYYAILNAGVGMSLAVTYACMVIGMFFFGWLIGGEKFTRVKALATLLGFVGLALVFWPHIHSPAWLALGAAAVSGGVTAFNIVLAQRLPYNATQSTLWLWTATLMGNVPMAILFHEPATPFTPHIEWLWLLIFAVASVIASWSFVTGLKLIDAGTAGILGLTEIVFAVIFGMVFFGERPTPIVLLGVVIIIAAAIIPYARTAGHRP
jgi:S-adenosylmethionine uptake transporter